MATSGQTTLASGLSYSGDAGAAGLVTAASANPGNGTTYSYAASYDDDLRLLSSSLSVAGGGALLYQVQPGYDAASNVIHLTTTLPGNVTDNQSFCYDEQNRLTWASSYSGTGPCGIVNNGGSLTAQGAKYTATYSYDNLDRLTSGPAGSSYTYGDAAHLHAATATSGGYTATYDAAGDMTCRAPTSTTTCTGSSPTGQGLTYDHEGQLVGWTSALSGQPTPNTAAFAYDGEGARVALKTTTGIGVVTTTDYLLGGLEEQQTVGGSVQPSSTLTEYYPLPGIGTAVRVTTSSTSTLSYLAGDQLGSVSVALSTSGSVTAQALYSPYGTVRYSSGTMPTAHGYTGQLADATTGLDYYGARYYDPTLGQFGATDTTKDGLDGYAYVGDDPETYTDPSGHALAYGVEGGYAGNGVGGGGGGVLLPLLALFVAIIGTIWHVNSQDQSQQVAAGSAGTGPDQFQTTVAVKNGSADITIDDSGTINVHLTYAHTQQWLSFTSTDKGWLYWEKIASATTVDGDLAGNRTYYNHLAKTVQGIPAQGKITGPVPGAPPVDAGQAGKHVSGHNNQVQGAGTWAPDVDIVDETQLAWQNGKPVPGQPQCVSAPAGKVIGTRGETWIKVHIGKGGIHGVPIFGPGVSGRTGPDSTQGGAPDDTSGGAAGGEPPEGEC